MVMGVEFFKFPDREQKHLSFKINSHKKYFNSEVKIINKKKGKKTGNFAI